MSKLINPRINLNGNTADDLIEKLKVVLHNIGHLRQAMIGASDVIHGRNFQIPDGDAIRREADAAWRERMLAIEQLDSDIRDMAMDIYDQKFARESHGR